MSAQAVESEHRVTPLELFFDLVFVFAFTQVTTLMLDDMTWAGFGRGLLTLAVLWWAWASYAWLTNTVDAEAGSVLAVMLMATGAMFVAALAVPGAFGTHRVVLSHPGFDGDFDARVRLVEGEVCHAESEEVSGGVVGPCDAAGVRVGAADRARRC